METTSERITEYLTTLDASPLTVTSYRCGLRKFVSLGLEINNDALRLFNAALTREGYKPRTRAAYLSALRTFINWLDATDRLPADYSVAKAGARLKTSRSVRKISYVPKIPDLRIRQLSRYWQIEEDMKPLERMETLRNRAIVLVMFSTAARVSEVAALTRAQVHDGVDSEVVIVGKGNKARTLFLSDAARTAIRAYPRERRDGSPALFISHRGISARPMSVSSIYRMVKRAASALSLAPNTSPHMIRHYVASDMLRHGLPLEDVQMALGHENIQTTRTVYAHTDVSNLRKRISEYHRSTR